MAIDRLRAQQYLRTFDFKTLFREELGWDNFSAPLPVIVEGVTYRLQGIAEKRGVAAFLLETAGGIPPYALRRKIERQVALRHREHLIVYSDRDSRGGNHSGSVQVWQWVRQEAGRPLASREHRYAVTQSGLSLIQKLDALVVTLQEEETIDLPGAKNKVKAAFDVEKITKKFYDQFKREHTAFRKFLQGVPTGDLADWYVSVMLNRLMFIYFIQKKGFLAGDSDYLRSQLALSRERGADRFYRDFLCPLFFEGFAAPKAARQAEVTALLGDVPYLNGGIFARHPIEAAHGHAIEIPDRAFSQLFTFFDGYQWHLDDRPLHNDNEINPDVLGFIFEKYINQKQMGAYYTKEDITEYIGKNTIVPYLLEAAAAAEPGCFKPGGPVWSLLAADPDRYLYAAAAQGSELPLPPAVAAGIEDVGRRAEWNKPAAEEYALPTEIWRETVARRARHAQVRGKLLAGEVHTAADLITYNLNIRQFAQDVIETCEDPRLLRALWKAIRGVSILDPTCGSGAFHFAALNILEPLYEACLDRMAAFVAEEDAHGPHARYEDFRKALAEVGRHPNQRYFITKSIIVGNLYGVDIMHEAVEIAKLRLFLKLVSLVEDAGKVEPLPDIDFNIRAGNTLVGFTSMADVDRAILGAGTKQERMIPFPEDITLRTEIQEQAEDTDRLFLRFRQMQTDYDLNEFGGDYAATKRRLRERLETLAGQLDRLLAQQYGVDPDTLAFAQWRDSHQPFHWFAEFYGIIKQGGFDVIIGNPPYVEINALKEYSLLGYSCESAGNLYAVVMERCIQLIAVIGRQGYIVPVSSVSTDRYQPLQRLLGERDFHYSSFDDRPSRLFDGLEHIRLTIHLIAAKSKYSSRYATRYNKWQSGERDILFDTLEYKSANNSLVANSFPKLTNKIEDGIIHKLAQQKKSLEMFLLRNNSNQVFYSRKIGYFLQVVDFVPRVLDGRGTLRPPSEFKTLNFATSKQAKAALCCLNSNLFYWFVTVFSDCRHVNKREVNAFPIQLDQLADGNNGEMLEQLADLLMSELQQSSEHKIMRFGHDTLTVQTIKPKFSYPTLTKIDAVLAQHYGFTPEELDFIINYDIKYRMGDALAEDGEEDEQGG